MAANMMLTSLAVLGSLLAMAPSASAHMIMKTPVPFGHPNNSPLEPSGADYPCKMPAASIAGATVTEFKVGENQTLSFEGTAVHGGGSCQLAVTFDNPPTKDSKFKVITSLEGGCPLNPVSFQVPPELPNGDAVFAWTWFNHIGNREMYMNCALIKISGGKDDKAAFDSLPDMAVANVAVGVGASCATHENFDYTFENPGKYVQKAGPGPFQALCGGASTGGSGNGATAPGGAAGAAPEAPAAPAPAPAPSAAPAPPPAASPAPAVPTTALTSTLSTMVTVTTSVNGPSPTGAAPTAAPAPTAPAPAPAAPQSSGAPAPGGSSCTTEGAIVCNGDSQFGICNRGTVVWQAVAPGTKCAGDKIAKREDAHLPNRRAPLRMVHRRDF